MKAAVTIAALAAALASTAVSAEEANGRRAASPEKPSWEFALTAYPTDVRGGDNYTSGIGVADRGPLHLEARYNYESVGARSAFVGWTFSGGDTIKWEVTPLLGGAWGTVHAFVPAVEASVSWREFDFYSRSRVRARPARAGRQLLLRLERAGLSAGEWLRFGLVAQRTRAYGGERDIQRGPFAQLTWRRVTLGGFWFNPGSKDQVFIAALGVAF
jgi:hypothetical protein